MSKKRIGVILPAYNEGQVIARVLKKIPRTLTVQKTTYQVIPIVVDDGSADNTALEARKDKKTHVLNHIINSGAGAATRTGLRYVRENGYDFAATMDADGQHSPKDLRNVLTAVIKGEGDVIIGSRLINNEGMPAIKVLGNKGLGFITRLLLGVRSSDSQSGLRAFNRKTIDTLTYRENGYAFCSEMLWRAQKAKLHISETPIQAIYTDYSKSKGQNNWNGFQIIKQLIKHRTADLLHE